MSFTGFTLPGSNPTTTPGTTTTFGTGAFSFNAASGDAKPAPTTAPALSFNFGSTQASGGATAVSSVPSTTQFSFGAAKPTVTTATTLFTPIVSSAASTTAAATTIATLGTTNAATTAVAPKLSFGVPTTATTTSAPVSTVTSTAAIGIQPVTSTAAITATGSLSFGQLEDSINKWTIDLEEQSKFFINQAKQLNAWDSLLISNGEKILSLNGSIERVKQQQQQLDQELDFILAQQRELEELITPLEKDLNDLPVTDIDRNQMYQFSEIIDSQLKQISDDLKEIIEHINESNKDDEVANPVTQISRILNAHMNSLQWIDRNTAQISSHLEQITKLQDSNRRNFALNNSYNNSLNM